jgi:hypothetical protein
MDLRIFRSEDLLGFFTETDTFEEGDLIIDNLVNTAFSFAKKKINNFVKKHHNKIIAILAFIVYIGLAIIAYQKALKRRERQRNKDVFFCLDHA